MSKLVSSNKMHVYSPYIKLAITVYFSSLVKAYVQQPESGNLKLAQLEQELQKLAISLAHSLILL